MNAVVQYTNELRRSMVLPRGLSTRALSWGLLSISDEFEGMVCINH